MKLKDIYLSADLNELFENGYVKSVNKIFPDENKNIVTSTGVKGETKFDAETRYAFIDDDIIIVAGKRSGLTWSTDKIAYNKCTTSDGSDISKTDFKKIQKVNGKYFAIKGYAEWIGNSSDAYEVYVSDDGKTWKKTYSATLEYPTCSLGCIIYNNGYYYVPGDVPSSGVNDIKILYRSQTAEPGTWDPITINYTMQSGDDKPLACSQIIAEDDNHIIIAALQRRDGDQHSYACVRLTIENDGTISDVFIKRDAIASTPGNQFFGSINADGQILVGGYGLFKINLIKSGNQVTDITSEKIEAFSNTSDTIAGKDNILRDIIFINGKYYIPTYYGEVYSINSALTECKLLYTAPEGGNFNSIQFIQDKFYIGGTLIKNLTKFGTIIVLDDSVDPVKVEILGYLKSLREILDGLTQIDDASDNVKICNTVNQILRILQNFNLI